MSIEIEKIWEKDADYLRSVGCTSLQSDDVRVAVFTVRYDGKPTRLVFDVYVKKNGKARIFFAGKVVE